METKSGLAPIFGPFSKLDGNAVEAYPKTGPVKNIVFWSFLLSANCQGIQ
jgi:hypothetical protein